TVLFVVDRSLSIPQEIDPATLSADGGATDLRWRRVQDFVNGAVANRGPGRRNDRAGAILFARRARLLGAPSPVDRLPISDEMVGPLDPHYTDIAGAIKLALASFPEGTGKRIVL